MGRAPQQQQEQQASGDIAIWTGFNGIDTRPGRMNVADDKCTIMDGFFPFGDGRARCCWDAGAAIYGSVTPGFPGIAYFDFGNIFNTLYAIVIRNDGGVVAVNMNTFAVIPIGAIGTIQNPGQYGTAITQWGAKYILIVSNQTNGYFLWDGAITGLYLPGQTVPGLGTMPTGIGGWAIEVYSSRVFITSGANVYFTAPGNPIDFNVADGGGSFTSNDSSLRVQYNALKQSNGYLYFFGDSSISYLSGIQSSGSPIVTTYSYQNVDPEVGTPWPGTVDLLGANIAFANPVGAHVSYGGRAAKISSELDGITFDFTRLQPSSAKAIIFGKRVYMVLMPVLDQITGQPVNKIFVWDEQRWSSTPQSPNLTFLQTLEVNSVLTAYGSDGTYIYPLFVAPTTNFNKAIQSKFWVPRGDLAELKAVNRVWAAFQFYQIPSATVIFSVDSERGSTFQPISLTNAGNVVTWVTVTLAVANWVNNASAPVTWSAANSGVVLMPPRQVAQNGVMLGFTIITGAPDIALLRVAMMPVPIGYRG